MVLSELELSQRRVKRSLIILLIFAIISTIGYYAIGSPESDLIDALYLTANVFSTVGAWNPAMSRSEEIWTILMIVFGIGGAVYAFSSVMALMTSGQIRSILGRRQLTGKIQSLSDHYIVCGFGRMGRSVCNSLAEAGRSFVLIDHDAERTAAADTVGHLYVLGEAADEKALENAGIARARGLVTCLKHDADNVFVTLTARGMNPKLTIIARSEAEGTEKRLTRSGADRVITPSVIGAHKITRMLLHPAVEDMIDAAAAEHIAIDRVAVGQLSGLTGRSLRDVALPKEYGVTVLAVETPDGRRQFNPPADHVLAADEQMILVGPAPAIDRLLSRHED